MVVGKIISLNVRGISNYKKRRTIFTWCRKQRADIIFFLQETHSIEGNGVAWKREWGAPLFYCAVSQAFWNDVIYNILSKLSSCGYLLLSDVIVGFLREEMGLENYVLLLGKIYLWDCRRNDNRPSITHFIQTLKNKYDTEKLIAKRQYKYRSFKNK